MMQGSDILERTLTLEGDGPVTLSGGADSVTLSDIRWESQRMTARTGPHRARVEAQVIRAELGNRMLVSVLCDGIVADLIVPDARAGQAARADTSNAVLAPMTGVVIQLLVGVGDTVKQGQTLGVIEAMKMETTLVAPRSGIVDSIGCSVGGAVEGGLVLITLEEEAAE